MKYTYSIEHDLWWKFEYNAKIYWKISQFEDDTNCNVWCINAETNGLNHAFEYVNKN